MEQYYDIVLGLIPVSFITIAFGIHVGGHSASLAVSIGGGVSALIMGHALFVNGPVSPTNTVKSPERPPNTGSNMDAELAD